MTDATELGVGYERCQAALASRGQAHALRWWDDLDYAQRETLLADVESIPWDLVDRLIRTHVLERPERPIPSDIQPPKVHRREPEPDQRSLYDAARDGGRGLLAGGKVAAFTVAGGQGTRLGIDAPKGVVDVTPVGNHSLFELFAEMVKAARRKYHPQIPWYIMTSATNHADTVSYFRKHRFFGLPEADVIFFQQGMLPAFDFEGTLLLAEKHRLALAPDGHGGSLKALCRSGALADMRSRGCEIISYFQVDNPLVMPFDALFIGLHRQTGAEMSVKVTPKADDLEKVGNVCMVDGKVRVIEYTELPEELAHARTSDGRRRFDSGNLAIHLLDVEFVDRIVGQSFQLPFRRAEQVVAHVADKGEVVRPEKPNGIKLETFVFDALPLAKNPLVFEVERKEEFSPVKNASGVDSLETAARDQVDRSVRWLEAAGVNVPKKPDGTPDVTVVIAPSFALYPDEVRTRLDRIPPLEPGDHVYLA